MASKNVIAKGTTYNGVESITLPTSPSGTAAFYEISDTTATASDVLNSKYFYTAAGVKTQGTGTAPSPTLIPKSITQNGTYNASSDSADGYSSVIVNVSGGGGDSSYTLIDSFEVTASTTSTTAETVYTYTNDALWDASSMLYVRIRDKAGKRANYFYGSDNFFLKDDNRNASAFVGQGGRAIIRYTSANKAIVYFGGATTGYGVYAYRIETNSPSYKLTISMRYNSNYSLTVDGTFTVEIYSLKWPDDISPFV